MGIPHPELGDPLKAAQLLLALASESSLAAHREWGLFFVGTHDQREKNQLTRQQPPCPASLYLAGALPRLGFEQMALGVQEADGDLVQRGSLLESQVWLPELSYRHPKEQGGLRPQQPSLCPWGWRVWSPAWCCLGQDYLSIT